MMLQGTLFWLEDQIVVKHFDKGDVVYEKLQPGQIIEVLQNDSWHKVIIGSITEEPFIADWNYGDCVGCDVRMEEPKKNQPMKAVVLSSGGLDSATCLGIAVDKYGSDNVAAISVFYGQRHARELDCARNIARYYGVSHYEFDVAQVMKFSDSALLSNSKISVVKNTYAGQMKDTGTNKIDTYVPFRNGLMLSIAASFADSLYKDDIELFIGVHKDDAIVSAYADCSDSFIEAMASAISIGTYGKIRLTAPFVRSNKTEIVRVGLDLHVPYHLTWSCYESGEKPCGKCATCIDRAKAFANNHTEDPILLINDDHIIRK